MLKPVMKRPMDGFSLVQNIPTALPYYQPVHALAQLDPWRRARSYALRFVVVPDESQLTVPARGEVEYQAKVNPRSWWYGFTTGIGPSGNGGVQFDVKITDQATGRAIFSDLINARQLNMREFYPTPAVSGGGGPILLEQPYPITEPGLLNVEIHNNSASDVFFQMVLNVMEPCTRPLTVQECAGCD